MNSLFAFAVLAALAALAARTARRAAARRARVRELASREGFSPDKPLRIASFAELDDAVDTLRCPCGGPLHRIGEAARPGARVARCECSICEEDVDLFFDLSQLRN